MPDRACPGSVAWQITYGHDPADYAHVCTDHVAKMLGTVYERANNNQMMPTVGHPSSDPHLWETLKCGFIESDAAVSALFLRINKLENLNDQLRVQLAGCGVAASGYCKGENDCKRGQYGWSPTLEEVKNLYKKYDRAYKALRHIAEVIDVNHPFDGADRAVSRFVQEGLKPLSETPWEQD